MIQPVNNLVVRPAIQTASKAENTLAAAGAGVSGLVAAGAGAITHNPVAEQNAINQGMQAINNRLALNKAFLTAGQAQQGGTALIKPTLSAAGQIAPYVVGGGIGKAAGLIKPALGFGAVNAASTALQGDFKPPDLAKSFALGAAPVAVGHGLAAGAKVAAKEVNLAGRPARLSDNQVANITNYRQQMGQGNPIADHVYYPAVRDLQNAGITHTDTHAIDNLLGQFRTYNTQREGGFVKVPSSSPLESPGKNLTPDSIPKQPGQGRGANQPPDFLKTSPGYKPKTAQQLADLSPKDQMALSQPKTELAPTQVNTAKNPYKSSLQNVEPGNYKGAIQNSQLVSRPVDTATGLWQNAMKRLSPEEQSNFWKHVESPSPTDSPQLKAAANIWRQVDNKVHGESQGLGGNTNYLTNHGLHPWQLPEEYTQHIINGGSPTKFTGLNNISRKYQTIAEGEKAGLTLGTDPVGEGTRYLKANAAILRKEALKQGLAQADSLAEKQPHTLDLGGGHTVSLSKEGLRATKSLQPFMASDNPLAKGLRTTNQGLKSTVLSLGQFHTINIGALRAAPTLIAKGHPVAAAKGLYGMFRGAFGSQYADRVIGNALKDGTVDKAAQIGMPYGGSGYDVSGTFLKHGVGSRTVFGKQIPMMHDQVARSIIKDLEKKNIPLNSPAAREAGLAGANMMGELNRELQNISPRTQRYMTDAMLAGQFTPSKFIQMGRAVTKGGVGGSYARANVAANVAATTAVIAGIGYLAKQKSDNVKDLLLRALVDPAAPTSSQDSKGNTIKLRTPGTDTSDVAKLLGIKLVRNPDGHLGVSWKGLSGQTAADFGRARLSPLLASGLKVATNTNYGGKPLYDPSAPAGTKTLQGATSVITGNLPIGLQGIPMAGGVEKHLPQDVQKVLDVQKPGTNPVAKSIGSSFGLTPSTDQTVGKGQQTAQFFDKQNQFVKSLDANGKSIFGTINPVKKNPLTGQPVFDSTIFNKAGTYNLLADNPAFTAKYQAYQQSQANHDPMWDLPKDQLQAVLLTRGGRTFPGQTYTKAGASLAQATGTDQQWYKDFLAKEQSYYSGIPSTGGGSKLDYGPQPSPYVSQQLASGNSKDPQVQQYLNDKQNYTNAQRQQQGLKTIAPFGQVGVPNQLDNPAQLAITPKGSSYGTGKPKASKARAPRASKSVRTSVGTRVRASSRVSTRAPKASYKVTKTPTFKIPKPKGVSVKKLSPPKFKSTRKIAVSKISANKVKLS